MPFENCHSSLLRSRSLLPDHVKGIDARRAFRLLRPVDTSDELGRTGRGGARKAAAVAMKLVSRRLHATSFGGWVSALVSSVAGGNAAGGYHARGPIHRPAGSPAVNQPLSGDPWVSAAYAEGQPWARDPRGSRVRCDSPRIPHDKVTTWRRPIKVPCQGGIIAG